MVQAVWIGLSSAEHRVRGMACVVGKTLAHYHIVEQIGAGGMGVVYKARDTHLDRFVALKVLPPEMVADRDRRRRFVQEAKAASALNHPNIIHIYDIANEDGVDFIAMEYVPGTTLAGLIGRKGLKLSDALGYAIQIADALNRAHSAGIIHRDLKPANIMVSSDGIVKLLDFGLAKLTEPLGASGEDSTQMASAISETGAIVGTVAYMSPEQAQGKTVDARSDIFSFGSVLYEMLTGKRAFQGEAAALTIASIIQNEPAPLANSLREAPPELERVLARCLRKDPQRRWQSMADLKIALLELKEDSESGKFPVAGIPPARRPLPLPYVIAACAVLIVIATVLLFMWTRQQPRSSEPELIRLTFDTGMTRYPAISSDGKLMAYASDRSGDGNFDIYVQQVGRPEAVRRTRHEANDIQPAFSPDGTRIVFRSERDGGGLYLFDSLVGEERRIADHGWHPSFSPDGTRILYAEVVDPHSFAGCRMYLVPSQGGEPKPFQPEFILSSHPSTGPFAIWSPDGKFIFFPGMRGNDDKSSDWWVAPLGGGPAVPTGAAQGILRTNVPTYPMAWFKNRIIWARGVSVEGFNLFWTEITPGSWQLSGESQPLTTGPGAKVEPSIAGDGHMVFSSMNVTAALWKLALVPHQGTAAGNPQPLTQDERVKTQPFVSSDGSMLAFGSYGSMQPGTAEVRLRDMAKGTEVSFPIRSSPYLFSPRLSPDGTLLSYVDRIANRRQSFLVSVATSASRMFCEDCLISSFFVGNKSAIVLYGNEVVRQDFAQGSKTPILRVAAGSLRDAVLSNDDTWLAFQVARPARGYITYACPVRDQLVGEQSWVQVAEESSYQQSPRWSADGDIIYFLSERDGQSCIWAQRLDRVTKKPAGPAFAVYHEHRARYSINQPRNWGAISVAKDSLVFAVGEGTGNVYMTQIANK